MAKHSNQEVSKPVNKRPCKECNHNTCGVSHGYEWQDCKKNWSDKQHGMMYGVIHDTCGNWIKKVES